MPPSRITAPEKGRKNLRSANQSMSGSSSRLIAVTLSGSTVIRLGFKYTTASSKSTREPNSVANSVHRMPMPSTSAKPLISDVAV